MPKKLPKDDRTARKTASAVEERIKAEIGRAQEKGRIAIKRISEPTTKVNPL